MSRELASGHSVHELDRAEEQELKKKYFMYTDGAVRLRPGNFLVSTHFLKYADKIYKFKVNPSDIFVASYPKSGTTWTQAIVWNLIHNPNADNPEANLSLDAKFPNIEADMFLVTTGCPDIHKNGDPAKMFESVCPGQDYKEAGLLLSLSAFAPSPRLFKTHLPMNMLPSDFLKDSKVLYVARNPKDVVSSMYHFARLQKLWGFTGTLDEFVDEVINDSAPFAPYWTHLKLAWDLRNNPNLCLVFYEDLKNDIVSEVKRIDKFLGTNRTEEQIKNVVHITSFSQMKKNTEENPPSSNNMLFFNQEIQKNEGGFFRKGVIGDWKNRFTDEQVMKLDKWIATNVTQFGKDFKYKV